MAEQGEGSQPTRKGCWAAVVAGVVTIAGIITWATGTMDTLSKLLPDRHSIARIIDGGNGGFTLRDAKQVSYRVDGAALPWRKSSDFEVMVEAVASDTHLKGYVADLDTGSGSGYYKGLT